MDADITQKYDVVLSFAGENREKAETIADLLIKNDIKVFYDKHEEAQLWGKDLYEHLSDIYTNRAKYCVILISSAYAQKRWTTHERRSAQARAFRERREYILPVRLDDTEIPGIPETIAYLDLRQISEAELVKAIITKLRGI